MITELHIFDFDGTLFRSPVKPNGWKGHRDWWGSEESLGRPCVPDQPDSSWWIGPTVTSAKESIRTRGVLAILATGRADNTFARWRVPELLTQAGIDFDRVHLSPRTGMAADFKARILRLYLTRFHTIRKVKIWEDMRHNIEAMEKVCEQFGLEYESILVTRPPKTVACEPLEVVASRLANQWFETSE